MTNDIEHYKATYAHLLTRCFDFSPPEGWCRIVESLLAAIDQILREADLPPGVFSVRQAKEKFGGLRVYVSGYPKPPSNPSMEGEWASDTDIESNPAPQSRDWHFDGVCCVEFAERIDSGFRARILAAIKAAACLPGAVAERVRARIEEARQEADRTCQLCGANGGLMVEYGWHAAVCEVHRHPEARAAWSNGRETPK